MITSTANARIKELVQFQKKSRARSEAGVFIAEGLRIVREAPPERLKKLYVTEDFYKNHKEEMPVENLEFVSPQVFSYISDTKTPQGVLAVVKQFSYERKAILGDKNARMLILETIQDPGNLGTIFRTAEAAGVTGIVMSSDCVDIYNPKVIRSTMGAIFRMPFFYAEDIREVIGEMQKKKIRVYAAALDADVSYEQARYLGKLAFLIGNEANGLRPETAACADMKLSIPMEGKAESLNAAVAAAVLMFEATRQRRAGLK